MKIDWKFAGSTVVAVAGILLTLYLYLVGEPKSLTVKTVSRTALQPANMAGVEGLKITIDGKELSSPWLVVIEVRNTGSRPIAPTEFEAALEIGGGSYASIVRGQVTDVKPKDLRPQLKVDQGKAVIAPLLLNPDDSFTIAAITDSSGAASGTPLAAAGKFAVFLAKLEPTVEARARISGISAVKLLDESKPTVSPLKLAFMGGFTFFAFLAFALSELLRERRGTLKPVGGWLLSGVTFFAAAGSLVSFMDSVGIGKQNPWVASGVVIGLVAVTSLFARLLRKPIPREQTAP